MRKTIISILAIAATVASSCTKEKLSSHGITAQDSVKALMPAENAGSKVHLNGTTVYWTAEDSISVFSTDGGTFVNNKYTLSSGENTAEATFDGVYEGEAKVAALYPYVVTSSYDGEKISVNMPESYSYEEGEINNAPMASLITVGSDPIAFKNAGALLAVTVNNVPAGYNKAVLTSADTPIAGATTISFDASGNPSLDEIASGAKVVTITWTAEGVASNKVFYFPLPVASYSSLEISITDGSTTKVLKTKALTSKRSARYSATVNIDAVGGVISQDADNVAKANELFEGGNTSIDIQTVEDGAPAIVLPAVDVAPVSITLPDTDKPIVINAPTGGTEPDVLNIYVPNGDISNITFNVPNTTVYVNGVLTDVSAYTADETLYIRAESEITGTLTVGKGNVRIEDGGKVAKIVRATENTAVVYVIYEAETAPTVDCGEGVVLVSAAEDDLVKAVADPSVEYYKLQDDIVLTQSLIIPASKSFTLDLNGMAISQEKDCAASYSMIQNNGTLTITGNGKISFKDTSAGDPSFGWGSYTISNSGTLIVENGTIEHLGEQDFATHMICAIFQYSGSTTIKDGVISTPYYRSMRLWKGDMTIEGGEFDGQLWVQAVDNTANLTITGGEFGPNGGDGSSVFVENVTYEVELSVTGGTFTTKIGCSNPAKEGVKGSVKGGIFTESAKANTNSALIAANGEFKSNDNGTYTLVCDPSKAVVNDIAGFNAAMANADIKTIVLGADLTSSEILVISRAVTLDGNDKKLTSSAGRAINVSGADGVSIKNLTIEAKGERGINIIQKSTNVVIDKVNVTAANYAVNVATSAPAAKVNISNSTLKGLNTVNVASPQSKIIVDACDIYCLDENSNEKYAAFILNSDAKDGKITVTECNIVVNPDSDKATNAAEGGVVTIDGSTDGVAIHVAFISYGDNKYSFETLAGAFSYVKSGETVTLIRDVVLADALTVTEDKNFTLDLNGKTISQEKTTTDTYAMILNKGNFTIQDGVGNGKISYKDIKVYTSDVNYASNTIRNDGVLTLKSGIIENLSGDDVMNYGYPHAIDVYPGSTTNIKGGEVKSLNYDSIRMFCNSTTIPTTLNISAGKIINRVSFQNPSSNTTGYGVLNITGGEFTTTGDINANVRLLNFSSDTSNMKAEVTGGKFDKGFKTQNMGTWTSNWDWLTVAEGVDVNKIQ